MELAGTIFRLANSDSTSEGLTLSAIGAAAIVIANQANEFLNGTLPAEAPGKRALKAVPPDPEG